jgi:hypothetical protein
MDDDTLTPDQISKIIHDLIGFIKFGDHPNTCVMENPHCDCKKGELCKLVSYWTEDSED